MTIRTFILPASALLLLWGCGGGDSPPSSSAESAPLLADRGNIELWMMDLMLEDRRANILVQQSGPSSWSTVFAPDASVIHPGEREIEGKEAIHESFMEKVYSNEMSDFVWSPIRAEVSRSGDMGYTVGEYLITDVDSAGARWVRGGMYVRIWDRQPDGSWKVQLETRTPVLDPRRVEEEGSGEPGEP